MILLMHIIPTYISLHYLCNKANYNYNSTNMNIVQQKLLESAEVKRQIVDNHIIIEQVLSVADNIIECFKAGGSVYFCGNGGSAADAQHLAAELSGRFYYDRQPLPSDALHCNTSFLTAVANDYSFDEVYARLINGIGLKGDILVGLSTSGNSKNIIKAFEQCRIKGIKTIAMTGQTGGLLHNIADTCICVPSTDTPRIQESHITLGHIICEIIESTLFPKK